MARRRRDIVFDSYLLSCESNGWTTERVFMDKLFFSQGRDYVKRDSFEYYEFISFFEKFLEVQRANAERGGGANDSESRLRIPFSLRLTSLRGARPREKLSHVLGPEFRECSLTVKDFGIIHQSLLMYEDFRQKRNLAKFAATRKLTQDLPIARYREQIVNSVANNAVTIIAGDTGCGKSTQVPQFLVAAGFTRIACTQPRRISAMALCRRVGFETLNEYGTTIAYQIRFETSRTRATRVLFLTEGVLLRQIIADSLIPQYGVIIVDEVHERHVTTDVLLGLLKLILLRRPTLKIVLMSATINIEMFSKYFDNAPVITVPGRLYPITVEYMEDEEDSRRDSSSYEFNMMKDRKASSDGMLAAGPRRRLNTKPFLDILKVIDRNFAPSKRGDVLIFLSGINEILCLIEALRPYAQKTRRWVLLPLHSTLSISQQDQIFDRAPEGVRKCIISTNIAETSVTIDGIRFVVDSGKVREMDHDENSRMFSLQEFWVSRAAAEQRKGRAGRTGPGHCYRLYSRSEYNHFHDFAVPEIRRVPLDGVLVQLKALKWVNVREFPYVESPPQSSVDVGMGYLGQVSAIDEWEQITPFGLVLASLPVETSVACLLVMSTMFQVIDPVILMAALMSVQSPFVKATADENTVAKHRREFDSPHGDPFVLLKLYHEWCRVKARRDNSRLWCRKRGAEEQRLYEATKLYNQFRMLLMRAGLLSDREDYAGRLGAMAGTRRELRQLQAASSAKRGRRVIRVDGDTSTAIEDGGEDEFDFGDADFKAHFRPDELKRASSPHFSKAEVCLIKFVLARGLYPNYALAEPANEIRKASDQIFSSPYKEFSYIHPSSCFAGRIASTFLGPRDILFYNTLLKTSKEFLNGVFKSVSLPYLLMTCESVDLDANGRRMVLDNFVLVTLLDKRVDCGRLVDAADELRVCLNDLLQRKLGGSLTGERDSQAASPVTEPAALPGFAKSILARHSAHVAVAASTWSERKMSANLAAFLSSAVNCSLKMLKRVEAISILVSPSLLDKFIVPVTTDTNPMKQAEYISGPRDRRFNSQCKGGVRLCPYIWYNSIQNEGTAVASAAKLREQSTAKPKNTDERIWKCPFCDLQLTEPVDQEIESHLITCGVDKGASEVGEVTKSAPGAKEEAPGGNEALRREYNCEHCGKSFLFTATESLFHKRRCANKKANV